MTIALSELRGRRVTVVEVGPRDGLQNERAKVATADKIAFVDRLSAAGLPAIEVSAFVSPRWVPQLDDASDVFAGIARKPGTRYSALVPNAAGLERAVRSEVLPEADRDRRELQPAAPATPVRHRVVAVLCGLVRHRTSIPGAASPTCHD